ncbi:MAG: aspartate aminotransferase family protein [Actinomycetota bacterium]|nr:aspartate aminotransferase family protein [Actinomycetota bacterium]
MTSSDNSRSPAELQRAAHDHLWLHFTRMASYRDSEVPVIVRGDGCYLEDANGKRYLDALAGLFAVQIGYSFGEEIGEAAAAQMRELPFYTNWSYAHPRAIELAAEVASLAPGDLNRVFFVNGGSEAVESAWKLARQYYAARGESVRAAAAERMEAGARIEQRYSTERRWKAVARRIAYHGTTMGALSINGIAALRVPFEPLVPDVIHVRNTNRYHRPPEETEAEFTAFLLEDLEEAILQAGPETVAMVIFEPVQNAGGSFTAPEGYWKGVREICDRYGILLCADEVITGFGRLGAWFGSERYDIRPDIITSAKGLSSAYAAIGAVIASDRVMEPFLGGASMYSHGITFGGHPVQAAIALKNIEIMKRERIVEHVAETQDAFHETLSQLLDLPIVGDVRGTGFFYALELVKDKETRETFSDEECETLLRGFLSPRLFERGLICRADDRGDPVVQVSPPLIAGPPEFDEIVGILGDVLAEAWDRMDRRAPAPALATAGAPEAPVSAVSEPE